jgi:succinyl-diaminopimelate desuccinylase
MASAQLIRDRIDRRGLMELARALVRIPTENPPGEEKRAFLLLKPELRRLGFRWTRVLSPAGRWNLLAERGFGPSRRQPGARQRTFLWNGHLDVVPRGDERAWRHAPFGAEVSRGKLWGRGSADMKGAVAAFLAAVEAVTRLKPRSPHRLALHLVSDEEALGGEGTGFLTAHRLVHADLAIVGEPTNLKPAIAAKGTLRGRIQVRGRAAHGATPNRGVNAIMHAAQLVERLSALKFHVEHPLVGRPTLNVGLIHGGVRTNVVPPLCTVEFDRRIVPGEKPAAVKRELAGVLADLRRAHPKFRATIEYGEIALPSEIPENAEVVRLACDAIHALEGWRPRPIGLTGTTDARHLIGRAGIPTLILGPGDIAQAHAADEFVRVEDLERAAAAYALTLACFLEGP